MSIFKKIKNLIQTEENARQEILMEKIEKINEEREKIIAEKNQLEKERMKIEEEKRQAENAKILAEKTKEEEIIFSRLKLAVLRLQDLESEKRSAERELFEMRTEIPKEKKESAQKIPAEEKTEIKETQKKTEQKPDTRQEPPKPETDETERNFWEKLEKIKAAEKRKEMEINEKAASQLTGAKKIAAFLGKTLKGRDEEAEKAAKEKEIILTSSQLPIDFYKDQSEIVIFAPLPGVDIKDLDVSIEGQNDIIKIKAESRRPGEENIGKEGRFALSECKWPVYYREINLNEEINVFGIEAKLINGVLILRLPILKPGQTRIIKRKIEVKQ